MFSPSRSEHTSPCKRPTTRDSLMTGTFYLLRCDVAWLLGLGRNAERPKIGSIPTHGANI